MTQHKYELKKSFKTRFLNIFRHIIMIPFIERWIAERSSVNPTALWKKIIPPDYLYAEGSIRSVTREGIKFVLDISNNVEHSIYFFGLGAHGFEGAVDDIKQSDTILDVGAFIGTASIIFNRINNKAQIFAFEPNPVSYDKAVTINRKNQFDSIKIFNQGVGSEPAKLKLYKVNKHNAGMSRILKGEQDYPYSEVDVTTIDKFVKEHDLSKVDFIKMDVEGFEYSVIIGGRETLTKHLPVLFIELDDDNLRENNYSASALVKLLFEYGYDSVHKAKSKEKVDEHADFSHCHYDIIVKKN